METALVRLADYLDSNDIPIDCQRRRRLDYSSLLPHELWLDICRRTGTSPFQRISGLPTEAAPGYRKVDEAPFRAEAARAAVLQTRAGRGTGPRGQSSWQPTTSTTSQ